MLARRFRRHAGLAAHALIPGYDPCKTRLSAEGKGCANGARGCEGCGVVDVEGVRVE